MTSLRFPSTHSSEGVLTSSDFASQFAASTVFAGIMAASAVSFRLWFTPVPITLQVLGVIMSGLFLGSRWGAISQLQYLTLGALGLPIFSNMTGGPAAFFGPTAGYLLGFVPGAYLCGLVFERLGSRTSLAAFAGGAAGIAGIYLPGALWLAVWLGLVSGKSLAECLSGAWQMGVVPFIGVDLLKASVASGAVMGGTTLAQRLRR